MSKREAHGWWMLHALIVSALIALFMSGCASVTQQPIQAQLAAACEQAASLYKDASLLYVSGQLSASQVQSFRDAEPIVSATCDPVHAPADLPAALNQLTDVLNQLALAKAQAKGN